MKAFIFAGNKLVIGTLHTALPLTSGSPLNYQGTAVINGVKQAGIHMRTLNSNQQKFRFI